MVVDPVLSLLTDPQALKGYPSDYFPHGPHWGVERVEENLSHFPVFWVKPPRPISSPGSFFTCDGNSAATNLLGHGGPFGLYGLLLPLVGISTGITFITGLFINVYHEYIAEGLYCDPSFCDLWISTVSLVVGLLIARFLRRYTE